MSADSKFSLLTLETRRLKNFHMRESSFLPFLGLPLDNRRVLSVEPDLRQLDEEEVPQHEPCQQGKKRERRLYKSKNMAQHGER